MDLAGSAKMCNQQPQTLSLTVVCCFAAAGVLRIFWRFALLHFVRLSIPNSSQTANLVQHKYCSRNKDDLSGKWKNFQIKTPLYGLLLQLHYTVHFCQIKISIVKLILNCRYSIVLLRKPWHDEIRPRKSVNKKKATLSKTCNVLDDTVNIWPTWK